MAAVLVLLSGVYFLLKSQNEKQQQEAQREAAKIPVTKDMDLQKISYTDGTDTMTFCKEENWIWEAEPEITLDQDVMTVMEETFSNLTADRELTGVDDKQAAEFRKVEADFREQMNKEREAVKDDREKMREKMTTMRTEKEAQIKKILTDEQYKLYQEKQKKADSSRKKGHGRR